MPRKPNYDFERREREKARALKKEERQRLKREKAQQRKGDVPAAGGEAAATQASDS